MKKTTRRIQRKRATAPTEAAPAPKAERPPLVLRRHRSMGSFSSTVDYTGWYGVSPKGNIVQLDMAGHTAGGSYLFSLTHREGRTPTMTGAGEYTVHMLGELRFTLFSSLDNAEALQKEIRQNEKRQA